MKPDRILLATGNRKKLGEMADILGPLGIRVVAPAEIGYDPDVAETGDTFTANAILKAEAGLRATGLWTLADDSGIEARALGGRPGVYSARYAGEPCDDLANNRKLVEELAPHADKQVQYRCVIALARPGQACLTWDGVFEGQHLAIPRGTGGFGYDPHVLLPDLGQTVAEMPAAAKHARSHRGQALRKFTAWLSTMSAVALLITGCGEEPPKSAKEGPKTREEQLAPIGAVNAVGGDGQAVQNQLRQVLEANDANQKRLEDEIRRQNGDEPDAQK